MLSEKDWYFLHSIDVRGLYLPCVEILDDDKKRVIINAPDNLASPRQELRPNYWKKK